MTTLASSISLELHLLTMLESSFMGEVKTTYMFSAFWTPFPSNFCFASNFRFACYQQAGNSWLLWYVSGALRRTYTLFYPRPSFYDRHEFIVQATGLIKGTSLIVRSFVKTTPGTIFTTLYFFPNGPYKLDRYITQGRKDLPGINTLASRAHK